MYITIRNALVIGFILGAGMVLVRAAPDPSAPQPTPANVVVLKEERLVTLDEGKLELRQIPPILLKQTGKSLGIHPSLVSKTKYAIRLNHVPLSRVMAALAYITGGVWEMKDGYYWLRPARADDIDVRDPRYDALLNEALAYTAAINPDDPSLPQGAGAALQEFRARMRPGGTLVPGDLGVLSDATVARTSGDSISVTYDDTSGKRHMLSYTYAHGRYQ